MMLPVGEDSTLHQHPPLVANINHEISFIELTSQCLSQRDYEYFCFPEQKSFREEQMMEEPTALNTSWDWTISPLPTKLCNISSIRVVVALQKANGSWALTSALISALGLRKTAVEGRSLSEDVKPVVWATVLALVWLHQYKWRVSWSELLEAKACRWLWDRAEFHPDECLEAANSLLGCFVEPTIFRI
ncbi:von Willebrand factor A domain-containing protein 5A [Gallus gallus]|uniref:von Willebrand factor A domain-containing protein 5A-like n=1 Tax=Gallus gallus TaxID=9031 RepID=UPI00035040EA|nr:von Willebrand factor A domain-containing protein 5A-like [Gallus gallus]XP_040546335.1 von Willebrand factor A domain-containing protein 5A [Gallus gallus]|eukprot:XP_015153802.1 von Willebrand factor A domain-containing protein 5A [Gallus gallus]